MKVGSEVRSSNQVQFVPLNILQIFSFMKIGIGGANHILQDLLFSPLKIRIYSSCDPAHLRIQSQRVDLFIIIEYPCLFKVYIFLCTHIMYCIRERSELILTRSLWKFSLCVCDDGQDGVDTETGERWNYTRLRLLIKIKAKPKKLAKSVERFSFY